MCHEFALHILQSRNIDVVHIFQNMLKCGEFSRKASKLFTQYPVTLPSKNGNIPPANVGMSAGEILST